jgi:predicted  nucleic acid-binding Zn-ribbon protein
MIRSAVYFAMALFGSAAAVAQTASPEPQMTQTLLAEIRQLRLDLQGAAATIQRVQIGMYRLSTQSAQVERAKERLEQTRNTCKRVQWQGQNLSTQVEQAEALKRNAQNSSDQQRAQKMFAQIQSETALLATQEQECQVEQANAEAQYRTEEGKMNELQDRLDRLDRVLAGYGQK